MAQRKNLQDISGIFKSKQAIHNWEKASIVALYYEGKTDLQKQFKYKCIIFVFVFNILRLLWKSIATHKKVVRNFYIILSLSRLLFQ